MTVAARSAPAHVVRSYERVRATGFPQAHDFADNYTQNHLRKHKCLKRSARRPQHRGMRLRLFLLAVVLSQTACINVEDFGAYWDKAGTDRALAGTWRQVPASPEQTRAHGYGIGNTIHLTVKADAYEMVVHDAEGKRPDASFYPVKTLDVGRYHFLLNRRTKGIMHRYSISGRTLRICQQFGPGMVEFLRARYPDARSVHKNKSEGEYLVIDTFDDEAFTILSNIPDQEKYWDCDQKWERVE